MRKEMETGSWRGQDKDALEAAKAGGQGQKPVPKPYMSAQYREDSMRTTGVPSLRLNQVAGSCYAGTWHLKCECRDWPHVVKLGLMRH